MKPEDRFRGLDWAQSAGIQTVLLYDNEQVLAGIPGEKADSAADTVDLVLQKVSRSLDPQPCVDYFQSKPTTLDRWVQNYDLHSLVLSFKQQDGRSQAEAYHMGDLAMGNGPVISAEGARFLDAYDALKERLSDDFIDEYLAQQFKEIQ